MHLDTQKLELASTYIIVGESARMDREAAPLHAEEMRLLVPRRGRRRHHALPSAVREHGGACAGQQHAVDAGRGAAGAVVERALAVAVVVRIPLLGFGSGSPPSLLPLRSLPPIGGAGHVIHKPIAVAVPRPTTTADPPAPERNRASSSSSVLSGRRMPTTTTTTTGATAAAAAAAAASARRSRGAG